MAELRFLVQPRNTMIEKQNRNIEEATERVKNRLPLEKLRLVPKYKDLSVEDYEQLVKDAETIALLILKALFLKK
jgi:predicted nucleic acid-binding protein